MVALGCKFLRICHLNNCATGIATQNKILRDNHFSGLPEKVINYFQFVALEVQNLLKKVGVNSVDKLIGRVDLLEIIEGQTSKQEHLDLQVILNSSKRPNNEMAHYKNKRNPPFDIGKLNQKILQDYKESNGASSKKTYQIKNYDRSVGASLSGYLGLLENENENINGSEHAIKQKYIINFKGVAGQSFGVWNHSLLTLNLTGDANDYVGKGMSGGQINIRPNENIQYVASRGAIIGNTCLYGATGGELFAGGQAGERFAVRNSGAISCVEGVGDHGCEYMTGGTVVVLGPVGENFAAGMTGGTAIILDIRERLQRKVNLEHVEVFELATPECEDYIDLLKDIIEKHIISTNSPWAKKISDNFEHYLNYFMLVIPKESSSLSQFIPKTDKLIANLRVVK
jgi:glutamate synthase (NADPH/NADH) large chain